MAINEADIATSDGFPVAWMARRFGARNQLRINGPDLMLKYCSFAESSGVSVYLYGGAPTTLSLLEEKLRERFPSLRIAGTYSPPFRNLSASEESAIVDQINESGAGVVWVGLGCPKQERWMLRNRGRVQAVMVGVGAAFDYHAGTIARAPLWMQEHGFEWMFRLVSEPRRLWRRYLTTNTLFVLGAVSQLAGRELCRLLGRM